MENFMLIAWMEAESECVSGGTMPTLCNNHMPNSHKRPSSGFILPPDDTDGSQHARSQRQYITS